MSRFICNSVFWKHRGYNFILSNLDAFCILLLPNFSGLDFQQYTERKCWEQASLPVWILEGVFSALPCWVLCLLQICHARPFFPHRETFFLYLICWEIFFPERMMNFIKSVFLHLLNDIIFVLQSANMMHHIFIYKYDTLLHLTWPLWVIFLMCSWIQFASIVLRIFLPCSPRILACSPSLPLPLLPSLFPPFLPCPFYFSCFPSSRVMLAS